MKAPSLDHLYSDITKHILLAQAYTEIQELPFLIKSCRLKPFSYIFERKSASPILYDWWFDEFGNSLRIINKKLEITTDDLLLKNKKIVCTDLYYGLSITKIAKISKVLYIHQEQENISISFIGIDNFIRSFHFMDGTWEPHPPLHLGVKKIKLIFKNLDTKNFKDLLNKEKSVEPGIENGEWLSFLPANKYFIKLLENRYDNLFSFL